MTRQTPLYETSAAAHGGRAGRVDSPDGQLQVRLAVPQALGGDGGSGSTPEQLFAAALAASFESAMGAAARAGQYPEFGTMQVQAVVGLSAQGDARDLQVALEISLPGLSREQAQHLVERGKTSCPFSRALGERIEYRLHGN